jgi:hypothetical protein
MMTTGAMTAMKRSLTVLVSLVAALLVLAEAATAQGQAAAPGRSPTVTVTRLVKLFGGLENDWLAAVRNRDEAALGALLAEDFEMRLASRPAEPIPRAEWIRHALAAPTPVWTVRQMAARDMGCTVVVSFRLEPGAGAAGARALFVVDTWVQAQGTWKVTERYAGAADEHPLGLPGEAARGGTLPKKY